MNPRRHTLRGLARGAIALTPLLHAPAFGAVFMDIEQAKKLLLPQASAFVDVALALNPASLAELAQRSQTTIPRGYAPQAWEAKASQERVGWVLFDRTIGKYDFIDYAVGFTKDGISTGLEILAYRESHGGEVRSSPWRKQFAGKKNADQLRFHDDIRNISGATMSCQHVTEGAQRLSVLAQWLMQNKLKA